MRNMISFGSWLWSRVYHAAEQSDSDLDYKVQYLVDYMDKLHLLNPEDGAFTFPDGETWFATRPATDPSMV